MKRPFSENADEWIGQEFDRVLSELIDNFIHYLKLNASLLCVCFSLENVVRVSVSHNRPLSPQENRSQFTIYKFFVSLSLNQRLWLYLSLILMILCHQLPFPLDSLYADPDRKVTP